MIGDKQSFCLFGIPESLSRHPPFTSRRRLLIPLHNHRTDPVIKQLNKSAIIEQVHQGLVPHCLILSGHQITQRLIDLGLNRHTGSLIGQTLKI
jgi:hypothetical protein